MSRAKFQGSATGQRLNLSRTSGGSKSTFAMLVRDWLVHSFEPNTDSVFVKYQTQHRVNFGHQPARVTRMTWTTEHGWISVTSCSRQVHQTQHNCGFKCQTNLSKIVGANTHRLPGIKQIIPIHGGGADVLTKGSLSQEQWAQLTPFWFNVTCY